MSVTVNLLQCTTGITLKRDVLQYTTTSTITKLCKRYHCLVLFTRYITKRYCFATVIEVYDRVLQNEILLQFTTTNTCADLSIP